MKHEKSAFPAYLTANGTALVRYTGKVPAHVAIPDGVTEIGAFTFALCQSLRHVTVPASVASIGIGAFTECRSLERVEIAAGVRELGVGVFSGCRKLTDMELPASLTEIGKFAFEGCASLRKIRFGGTMAQWEAAGGNEATEHTTVQCADGDIGGH